MKPMKNAQGTSAFHFLPLTIRSFFPLLRSTVQPCFTRIAVIHSDCLTSFSSGTQRSCRANPKKTALQLMRVQRSFFDFEKDLIMLQQVLQRFQLLLLLLLHLQRLQLQPVLQPMQLSFPSRAQQFCR